MDRQLTMIICGIVALAIYSLSWVFQIMHWPYKGYVRLAALIPFAIGAIIWIYDRQKKAQAQQKRRNHGWEDILEDEDESSEKD
jgi:cbb3-type cytochrome oxidase subunit 3